MGRIKNVVNAVGSAASAGINRAHDWWLENRNSIINGAILGLAAYGASEVAWSLIGGRSFEHRLSEAKGYENGFRAGQQNAVKTIQDATVNMHPKA